MECVAESLSSKFLSVCHVHSCPSHLKVVSRQLLPKLFACETRTEYFIGRYKMFAKRSKRMALLQAH